MNKRHQDRIKAVLPVKVWGKDSTGSQYSDLTHTLDIAQTGARLAIHRPLNVGDAMMLQYRQRKAEFRVVWIKVLLGKDEYQVGLRALAKEKEPWGLQLEVVRDPNHAAGSAPAIPA
jgi:hypothetical protein